MRQLCEGCLGTVPRDDVEVAAFLARVGDRSWYVCHGCASIVSARADRLGVGHRVSIEALADQDSEQRG